LTADLSGVVKAVSGFLVVGCVEFGGQCPDFVGIVGEQGVGKQEQSNSSGRLRDHVVQFVEFQCQLTD